ncbi:MAG: zinc ribbon domain-containing protein [Clostridiaceae bacterium]|nr:zinc ribbon domain-containing protein [Clostridiaceae bacterium]
MYCMKCGTELRSSDLHCPKCGAVNGNYSSKKEKIKLSVVFRKKQRTVDLSKETVKTEGKKKGKIIVAVMIAVLTVCIAAGIFWAFLQNKNYSNTKYQSRGVSAITSNDGTAYFFMDEQIISFDGNYSSGKCTPDHSKFVLLSFDGSLQYVASVDSEPILISSEVDRIINITDDGCMYSVADKVSTENILKDMSESYRIKRSLSELKKEFSSSYNDTITDAKKFYKEQVGYAYTSDKGMDKVQVYNFKTGARVELGISSDGIKFADNSLTFARIDDEKKLSMYIEGEDTVKELCSIRGNGNISGISADGKTIIWSEEREYELLIYMMKDNVPERIARWKRKPESSSNTQVVFFDKGFIVTCGSFNKLLFSKDNEVKELSLSGSMDISAILDDNGNSMQNNLGSTDFFYLEARRIKDYFASKLYKLDMNGDVEWTGFDTQSKYSIKGNRIFYKDEDNDFCVSDFEQDGISDSICITTEIDYFRVSEDGSTAYIVKAEGLYYWDTNDDTYRLHKIYNDFGGYSKIFMTEDADAIFYLTDMQDITDTYSMIGTLYYYKKGLEEPQKIAANVYTLKLNDYGMYSSTNPIIVQYSKENDYGNILYNIGSLKNNQMEVMIQDTISY